jgi:hypothetical protein
MAFQLMVTDGLHARGHASGDDSGIIIMKPDKEKVAQRIGKYAASKATYCTYGMGLLIDQPITWDDQIMVFLSKIIDFESYSVSRQFQNVAATGCITSSKIPMAQINHAVLGQLKEYLRMIGFNGMEKARMDLEMQKAGKLYLSDHRRLKDDIYKEDFAYPGNVPYAYLKRIMEVTGGAKLTHHNVMDTEILRMIADVNLSNCAIADSNILNQSINAN